MGAVVLQVSSYRAVLEVSGHHIEVSKNLVSGNHFMCLPWKKLQGNHPRKLTLKTLFFADNSRLLFLTPWFEMIFAGGIIV